MINWFDMPAEGLSNGGLFEIKELTATENKVYQKDGEVYNKVTVNVEGGGGSSDLSTAEVVIHCTFTETHEVMENVEVFLPLVITNNEILAGGVVPMNNIPSGSTSVDIVINVPLFKNKTVIDMTALAFRDDEPSTYSTDTSESPTATGNATFDGFTATITGNATLNVPMIPLR